MFPEDIEARDIEQTTHQADQEAKLGWTELKDVDADILTGLAERGTIETMTDAQGVRLYRMK